MVRKNNGAIPSIVVMLLIGIAPTFTHANSGTVNFSGSVSAPTCTVAGSAGASGSGHGITVPLGDVPINELTSGDWVSARSTSFVLTTTCPGDMSGYSRARATFNATMGTGTDPNDNRMLRLSSTSTAGGVAIGIYVPGTTAPLNMSTTPSVAANFSIDGGNSVARMDLRAQYKRTSGAPNAGSANASLPLTLTYE